MMRLVFLFVAEERRLLPIDDPRYAETLAASTLRAQLQERADRDGEDPLERSTAAWHRVLALFRAVHGGIEHDALRLPAYGGGLFDPDRYPFLEGRPPGTRWHEQAARAAAGRRPHDAAPARRAADARAGRRARAALLPSARRRADRPRLRGPARPHRRADHRHRARARPASSSPSCALGEIEALGGRRQRHARRAARQGDRPLRERRSARRSTPNSADERRARLRAACANDDGLLDRVAPYHALLREDLRGDPLVFLAGSLFVTQALDRRASGTYYTPRALAEEVVRHALDPVVYDPGPAQERDLRSGSSRPPRELLDLKVADIAMGSGAFLVAACRYLAARLLEAWAAEAGTADGGRRRPAFAGGDRGPGRPARARGARPPARRRALPVRRRQEPDGSRDGQALAVADHARQGPARSRSSTTRSAAATRCSASPTCASSVSRTSTRTGTGRPASTSGSTKSRPPSTERSRCAASWRRSSSATLRDAERKAALLAQADAALTDARLLGDLVVGAALAQLDDADPLAAPDVAGSVRTMVDHEAPEPDRDRRAHPAAGARRDWLVERRRAVGDVARGRVGRPRPVPLGA